MNQFKAPKDWSKTYIFKNVVNGLFVALPLIIILAVIVFLVRLISKLISPFSKLIDPGADVHHWTVSLFSFLIVIGIFFVIGVFMTTKAGIKIYTFLEDKLLKTIPFYNTVSNVVNQFRGVGERPFQRVVLIDAYGSGVLMTGFVVERINELKVVVYVPTAPNPTNGFVLIAEEKDLIDTDAKTEDAMGTVIAVGAGSKKLFETTFVAKSDATNNNDENFETDNQ